MQTDLETSTPTPIGPLPTAPPRSFNPQSWLEGGTAILDAAGCVLGVNEPLGHWLERTPTELLGQPFWEALGTISSQWKEAIVQISRSESPFDRVSLKLASPDSQSSQWFNLETARHQGNCFVRLSSVLPPLSELEESVWDEHLGNESARREAYVRLLRAE